VLVLLLAAASFLGTAQPVGASTSSRLAAAKKKLSDLTAQITSEEAQASGLLDKVNQLSAQIDAAAAVENRIAGQLAGTRQRIAQATEQQTTLQTQLDTVAQTLYMQGGISGGFLEPLLSSSSMADFGDRLAFAQAVGQSNIELANQVADTRAMLDSQAAQLGQLHAQQVQLLNQLSQARAEKGRALVDQQTALANLDKTKNSIVSLIVKLHRQLLAQELTGIGNAFQGDGHISYGDWSGLFLKTMGVPSCHQNMIAVVAWQYSEFTQAAWNPLATTHPMPGSTYFNSSGVQNYPSLAVGLQATKSTIDGGWRKYGYGAIIDSLSRCAQAMATGEAINASSWCAGCTYGTYVIGNIPKVEANYAVYASL
jgi:peptidoglycan hydrolase CwlO-like protein